MKDKIFNVLLTVSVMGAVQRDRKAVAKISPIIKNHRSRFNAVFNLVQDLGELKAISYFAIAFIIA